MLFFLLFSCTNDKPVPEMTRYLGEPACKEHGETYSEAWFWYENESCKYYKVRCSNGKILIHSSCGG